MRKYLLTLAVATLSTVTYAQSPVSFGVRAGVSNSGMRGDAVASFNQLLDVSNGLISTNNRTGFFAGGYVNVPITDRLSFEPAVYYSQKGMELQGNVGLKGLEAIGANAKARLNTSYIDVPLVLKANLNGFQVFAGPQIAYLNNATLRASAGVLGFNLLNTSLDATKQLNRWDAALTGGVGYQFGNGVNITAAYDHGITRTDANRNANAYNRGVKVGIGMQF